MKVLIAGASGYIGRHVTKVFVDGGLDVSVYNRSDGIQHPDGSPKKVDSDFLGYFDIVINCARPHWSEFSPDEIADIECKLLEQLDSYAAKGSVKIHTSGIWLFGNASTQDLKAFRLKPLEVVKLDVDTIAYAVQKKWHVVYCPSLVYGGENCQLKRAIQSLADQMMQVATPSLGYNQYIHVEDIARFYLLLAEQQVFAVQHFIAEIEGYSPEAFSQLLLDFRVVKKVHKVNWSEFEEIYGASALEIERLNLELPVSPLFVPTESLKKYIENFS
ncbi:NAD(P)-dependent oxidoreductase [Vibrio sp. SCSIO 43136]|uniref:NAD-dependent epimerase/dehydratase family protein n=1 Tax=Vibrio sp. SCSIO 43136 TaxID=2819101 RepID=UPI00207571FB|nr:NAD(P)-dependent oxidoreductase [Vibrio sp. SCSIO 43136]USD66410.1 NAD(P)-dependent oxidoreductase [Vibrio sp. SCSIO 43136]